MTDCPEKLTTGASLIVTADVYILPSAFKSPDLSKADERPGFLFSEGSETMDETILRERKTAIVKLFDILGLKPQRGANVVGKSDQKLRDKALRDIRSKPKKKVIELVGDGEEIEVEEGEEDLSKNDIDMIYQKYKDFCPFYNPITLTVWCTEPSAVTGQWARWSLPTLLP